MSARPRPPLEREQLDLFQALPGVVAPRDAQDLMAYPFFSLAKSRRIAPIDFRAGDVAIRVEAMPDHGMATIWDADILIWAASQIVNARDAGLRTSRLMDAPPYEIHTFVGRGVSKRDYLRLKAALDRLQSTSVVTSIRRLAEGRRHRFSWINDWQERFDRDGRPLGVELILPDWFYRAVMLDRLVRDIEVEMVSLGRAVTIDHLDHVSVKAGALGLRRALRNLIVTPPRTARAAPSRLRGGAARRF